jgi:hypothetical protein
MVGTSPDRRTKTDIREKKKAAIRIKRIPLLLLPSLSSVLTVFDLFFWFPCPVAVIVLIFSLLTGLNRNRLTHDRSHENTPAVLSIVPNDPGPGAGLELFYNTFSSRQFVRNMSCRKKAFRG